MCYNLYYMYTVCVVVNSTSSTAYNTTTNE